MPLLDVTRAREGLGWKPTRGADEALLELIEGMRESAGAPTPSLDAAKIRLQELAGGVGSRD